MAPQAGAAMRIAVPTALAPHIIRGHDPQAAVVRLAGATMGTAWRVDCAAPASRDLSALRGAIDRRLDGLVAEMSHWDAESLLCRFNRAPAGSWTALPPDFATVVAAALDIAEASDGAFDPAIGALVDLWGHGPPGPVPAPADRAIARALAVSGWRRLALDRAAPRLRQPGGLQLDLSGIAKGYAVDAIASLLEGRGVHHALVEIGGELCGLGMRPDGDPWWVDLENPPGAILPRLRIALHDLSVATSGNYVRGDHTIDPVTGRPCANGIVSVSVLHRSAMVADAWASALTVLGHAAGLAAATRHGLAARIVATEDGTLVETVSPALDAML